MKIKNVMERSTNFGSKCSRKNFFSFTFKIILYILPAIIIGHYTDIIIKKLKIHEVFGKNNIYYILLQTLFIIITLYLFVLLSKDYVNEFQETIAGSFFIVIYFGIQINYIYMLKEYMNTYIYL